MLFSNSNLCTAFKTGLKLAPFKSSGLSYARFYQLGINLGIANPRSEDNPRFILGSSFSVLSTFSNLGITNLGITRLSL